MRKLQNKKKVSVIIPIYNVESYLEECVESILNQTYKNLEIILVDDESPDNCPEMCDKYAVMDTRIKVVHKKNGGLSDARNVGIEAATGEYLCFIDSDDYITLDMIEQLMYASQDTDADIAVCGCTRDHTRLDKEMSTDVVVFSNKKAIKEILIERKMNTSAWAKIYKKELFDSVRFPKGKIYEDYATIYKVIHAARRIACVDVKKYYYRHNPVSITGAKFYKKQLQYFEISNEVEDFVKEKYPKFLKHVRNRATRVAISFFRKISETGFDDTEAVRFLISYVRKNIFRYVFSGYAFTSKIYGILIFVSPKLALRVFKNSGK